ncbi:MAG: M23 family metallopeptidase [Holophagales bacterium]|jgi:hypothetical protein|nr:M23 family metallopeptidase [Holophagales bacterium]
MSDEFLSEYRKGSFRKLNAYPARKHGCTSAQQWHPDAVCPSPGHREFQVGENVQLDTILGTVGNTGASSTGPHLHFEVLVGGFSANPIKVIRAARNVQQIN